jgi:CHASE2 domain-containing sensor protein
MDEKTCERLGNCFYSRRYDAQTISALVAMGAKHIYFDRAFSSLATPEEDRAMIEALRNSHGKVSFGATSKLGQSNQGLQLATEA